MKINKIDQSVDIDWSFDKIQAFRKSLLDWYDVNKRDLPWRKTKDPYKIWVSEIMLQQTQVATVIPYYNDFIEKFPDVQALANASEHDLLQMWQGLGYYSRVRNMQQAAQMICDDYHGVFPSNMKDLLMLKGIGPYTAAAIGSMAFGLVEPAIDGNLMRIISRLFELDIDIVQPKSRKIFQQILNQLIDPQRPGDFNQALMDIGATVMTPSNLYPENNPLRPFNASHDHQTAHLYPVKTKKVKASHHQLKAYIVITSDGEYLLRKHTDKELLTGLWHFPIIEVNQISEASAEEQLEPLESWLAEQFNTDSFGQLHLVNTELTIGSVKHIFSHRVWNVQPIVVKLTTSLEDRIKTVISQSKNSELVLLSADEIGKYPISTLQSKLLKQIGFE